MTGMTIIENAVYVDGHRAYAPLTLQETLDTMEASGGLAWIGLYRPDERELNEVADELHLHELSVEDALTGSQRAKIERYDDSHFIVLLPARYLDDQEIIEFGELSIFVGKNYVVTVRHAEDFNVSDVRQQLEREPEELAKGPDAIVHALVDRVVDDYFPVVDGLENDVQEIEDQLFSGETNVSRRIYELSREVIQFQNALAPIPTILSRLGCELREDHDHDSPDSIELQRQLRDVNDHVLQLLERIRGLRSALENALSLASTLVSAQLAEQGVKQNEQMKKISSWAAIIFAPQLIGSIYGMNFHAMPELAFPFGYPMAIGMMLAVGLGLYLTFKRNNWL